MSKRVDFRRDPKRSTLTVSLSCPFARMFHELFHRFRAFLVFLRPKNLRNGHETGWKEIPKSRLRSRFKNERITFINSGKRN